MRSAVRDLVTLHLLIFQDNLLDVAPVRSRLSSWLPGFIGPIPSAALDKNQ